MDCQEVLKKLKSKSNPKNIAGMARFGINPENTLGVSIPDLRGLAKEIGKNHKLAGELWKSGIHEAKILAGMVDCPESVTDRQMDRWVRDFDSWDVCDQVCMNLFDKTPLSFKKAAEWTKSPKEFVKRAGFSMMACLAWHDKVSADEKFAKFFPLMKNEAVDGRNFVKKAVNWALRQTGKRNLSLNKKAIKAAREIQKINSKSAKWIASDAIRELESPAVQKKLNK